MGFALLVLLLFPRAGHAGAATPTRFSFSSSSYSASESSGSATITVNFDRGAPYCPGATGSVHYATSDGTAAAGSDYTAVSGVLSYAGGDTTKQFTVPLAADSQAEGDETVNLTLSSPQATGNTGGNPCVGMLATPSTATLTITNSPPPDPQGGGGGGSPPPGGTEPQPPGGANPPPGGNTGLPADTVAPTLANLAVGPSAFSALGSGQTIGSAARGTRVSYRLSEAGTARFSVQRARSGRRARHRCVAPRARNRHASRCTRYVAIGGRFSRPSTEGPNAFRFTGRLRGHKLAPGRYRFVVTVTDGAGNKSAPRRAGFRIVPAS